MTCPPHTVIYTHGPGRLGNQVIRLAHWAAWARHHEGAVEVVDFSFWPHAEPFAIWSEHPGCVVPVRAGAPDWCGRLRRIVPGFVRSPIEANSRAARALQSLGRVLPNWQAIDRDNTKGESIDLSDAAFYEEVTRRRVTTCCGWRIASWPLFAQYEAVVRPLFRPAERFARPSADYIASLRARHDLLIGVLIRQTDYRTWKDGRFFFSTAEYAQWMWQLLDLHPGKNVGFVIASDERQDETALKGLPYHFATGTPNYGRHWFENWVQLAACDAVLTAPSTFSATAAFLGGVPLWPVTASNQAIRSDQVIANPMVDAAAHPIFSLVVK